MKATGPVSTQSLPPHVPPDLVRPYPFPHGHVIADNPFRTVIPQLNRGPEVFYTLDGYHGMGPLWMFRKYKDVQAIYTDTEHFSSKDIAPFAQLEGGNWNLVPAESDPPVHALHRQMTNPLFTPKRMSALEDHVRQVARASIAAFKDDGRCDFIADMAFKFPIFVFLELMALPLEHVDQFLAWEMKLIHPKDLQEAKEGTLAVVQYLREVIAARRKNPGDDLVSYGIQVEAAGRKMTEDELLGFCFNLFIGGLDTVSTNMGWQFRHLAENPQHQQQLRADPALIPMATEELLRAYAAVTTNRRVIKPVTLGGVQLVPGDMVAMPTPLANNDAEMFPDPQEVRLDRNPRHISFGTGIHRCLGAPLARRELLIATEEMLKTLPEFHLEPGAEIKTTVGAIIQLQTLPLVWNA
jgi:cytochrome P450